MLQKKFMKNVIDNFGFFFKSECKFFYEGRI